MPTITGTSGPDSLAGSAEADTIVGLAGPDTISGGDGADVIYGGNANFYTGDQEDNDLIDAGAGADRVFGGDGDDTINGGAGNDHLSGGREIGGSSPLVASEQGRYLVAFNTTVDSGGFSVYDTQAHRAIFGGGGGGLDTLYYRRGFAVGTGDVSEAAGQIVMVRYSGIAVWNVGSDVTFARDLSAYERNPGDIIGAHFSADGRQLYVWDNAQQSVIAFDRATWQPAAATGVKTHIVVDSSSTHQGEMTLVEGGRFLLLDTGSGIEAIDVANLSASHSSAPLAEAVESDGGIDLLTVGASMSSLTGGADLLG